jgi:hypothetical protein
MLFDRLVVITKRNAVVLQHVFEGAEILKRWFGKIL